MSTHSAMPAESLSRPKGSTASLPRPLPQPVPPPSTPPSPSFRPHQWSQNSRPCPPSGYRSSGPWPAPFPPISSRSGWNPPLRCASRCRARLRAVESPSSGGRARSLHCKTAPRGLGVCSRELPCGIPVRDHLRIWFLADGHNTPTKGYFNLLCWGEKPPVQIIGTVSLGWAGAHLNETSG